MELTKEMAKEIIYEYETMCKELDDAIEEDKLDEYLDTLNIVDCSECDEYIDRYVAWEHIEFVVITNKVENRTYVNEDITTYDNDDYGTTYSMDEIYRLAETGELYPDYLSH
jgi:hypothetical protein